MDLSRCSLGYNDMGYVNRVSITPHIDALRSCGVHLDQFYTFKMCGPSRGSMLVCNLISPLPVICLGKLLAVHLVV
jgi:hypothetical protein